MVICIRGRIALMGFFKKQEARKAPFQALTLDFLEQY